MLNRIGLLLPRSTDYPSMGYDILDGLQCNLKLAGNETIRFFTENIGFGEDNALNYAKAEKLLLQDNAEILIAYCNSSNAESLYPLAGALNKPFIILDAGMQLPQAEPSAYCYHISLQGVHACHIAGYMAGTGNRKVLMATSFYDGGYRGPWSYDRGLSEAGGSVCGNYVSGYKLAEFTIDPYIGLLHQSAAASVAACFSSYLAELFFKALHEKNSEATPLPFYCSPFMAEEQMLAKCDFPGGDFHAVVPWAFSVKNKEQEKFVDCIQTEKNKKANIFHLLGWEAGIIAAEAIQHESPSLEGFSYDSPRGNVVIHPATHYTYAPLYKGRIIGDKNGKCMFNVQETIPSDAAMHTVIMNDKQGAMVSGWRNNYLCI
ncbi:MAG: ABC transporter substrate-binding protein [Bacteroidota bacterium]|nr:ABC transporter substrate-binding protein [Bacteroidota bacterium]